MAQPVQLQIGRGEQIAIIGDNAAGKSRLVDIITGRYPLLGDGVAYDFSPSPLQRASDNIRRIAFSDAYGEADSTYYLQQRWNQHDIDPSTPTAGALLQAAWEAADRNISQQLQGDELLQERQRRAALRQTLYDIFGIEPLENKYIISLSSGELRKFQLTRTLMAAPRMLVLDNPFVGLDAATRQQLRELLSRMVADTDLQVVIEVSRETDVPDFITHVVVVKDLSVAAKITISEFRSQCAAQPDDVPTLAASRREAILSLPSRDLATTPLYTCGGNIVDCDDVTISYGGRTILDHVNWHVREGQRWALTGPNGAGKSTLLSLVCADNPQAYATPLRLFGHQRGTGESIWEIKRHIGYVSPEMHRAYRKELPAIDIVASGLSDSMGLYHRPTQQQREACMMWMDIFGISHLAQRNFMQLSSGEQRMCLLARAFVKDPELLVLDEPMHGLDNHNRAIAGQIIETFCQRANKTLIMVTHYADEIPQCVTHRYELAKPAA